MSPIKLHMVLLLVLFAVAYVVSAPGKVVEQEGKAEEKGAEDDLDLEPAASSYYSGWQYPSVKYVYTKGWNGGGHGWNGGGQGWNGGGQGWNGGRQGWNGGGHGWNGWNGGSSRWNYY